MFEHFESTCILSHRDCDCNLYSSLFAHSYLGWVGHTAFMGEQEMQVKFWLQSRNLRTFQHMHNIFANICNIITVDKYSENQWLCDVLEWEVHCNDCLTVCVVPSVQQKSSSLKFSKSRTGSHVTYSCHHNSSHFTFPIFVHLWHFSVFHSFQ